ncbi:MAG: hypothetical protein GY842_02905 [bacterium]|nr:hypothetical protein [bacterium]
MRIGAVGLAVGVGLVGCTAPSGGGDGSGDGGPMPGTVELALRGTAFVPRDVVVSVGDTVVWTNFDQVSHTVTSDEPGDLGTLLDSDTLGAGDRYEFTFNQAGEFVYFCESHPQVPAMVGATVTVE